MTDITDQNKPSQLETWLENFTKNYTKQILYSVPAIGRIIAAIDQTYTHNF